MPEPTDWFTQNKPNWFDLNAPGAAVHAVGTGITNLYNLAKAQGGHHPQAELARQASLLLPGRPLTQLDKAVDAARDLVAAPAHAVYNTAKDMSDLMIQGRYREAPQLLAKRLGELGSGLLGAQQAELEKVSNAAINNDRAGMREAPGHLLAGVLPLLGPQAAQAGTEIGAGEYGEGLVTAGAALAPSAWPYVKAFGKTALARRFPSLAGKAQGASGKMPASMMDRPKGEEGYFAFQGASKDYKKPSVQFVGTGEGLHPQDPWGTWLSSKEAVADWYRQQQVARERLRNWSPDFDVSAVEATTETEKAAKAILEKHSSFGAALNDYFASDLPTAVHDKMVEWDKNGLIKKRRPPPTGFIHKVDIPEPDQLLDLDKKLGQQSPEVQAKVDAVGKSAGFAPNPDVTGRQLLNRLHALHAKVANFEDYPGGVSIRDHAKELTASLLKVHGIDGHTYVSHSGNRNFIMINDEAIQPVAKSGPLAERKFTEQSPNAILDLPELEYQEATPNSIISPKAKGSVDKVSWTLSELKNGNIFLNAYAHGKHVFENIVGLHQLDALLPKAASDAVKQNIAGGTWKVGGPVAASKLGLTDAQYQAWKFTKQSPQFAINSHQSVQEGPTTYKVIDLATGSPISTHVDYDEAIYAAKEAVKNTPYAKQATAKYKQFLDEFSQDPHNSAEDAHAKATVKLHAAGYDSSYVDKYAVGLLK